MAISSRIPMVGTGGDIFKDVMDYFEQVNARKAQQQLQQQQLAQQSKYQQGELGIRQQEANIAAKQFADEHAKALLETDPRAFAKMFADLGSMGGGASVSPSLSTNGSLASPVSGQVPSSGSMTPLQRMWMKKYMGLDETPEEKQQRAVQTAIAEEQGKADVKNKEEDNKYFQNLVTYADNNEAISGIMDRNPATTSAFSAGKKYFKLGGKDQAAFNRLSIPMIGDLGRQLSQRGGAVALNYASGGKYDLSQPLDYNQGILEQNNNAIIRDYNREAQVYKQRHGVDPPYKLSPYYDKWAAQQQVASNQSTPPASSITKKWVLKNGKLEQA